MFCSSAAPISSTVDRVSGVEINNSESVPAKAADPRGPLTVLSVFTGIGGLDLGLTRAGHRIVGMCENWEPAKRVLRHHFPRVPLHHDVSDFEPTSSYQLLAAGFPCTDLSHAGGKAGIFGPSSGLVAHVFRLAKMSRPEWILLENVPNLLSLHAGAGMNYLTSQLEGLGYRWAYRTIDTRTTGLPQRRRRVLLLASLNEDPAPVLLDNETSPPAMVALTPTIQDESPEASGFYWTEGRNGLGLVPDAIPTLKGGSTLGLPSEPAIWIPGARLGRRFVLPSNEDGEALQGLPRGWTQAAVVDGEKNLRWKLIGNAVPTTLSEWVGRRLSDGSRRARRGRTEASQPLDRGRRWPPAGRGDIHGAWADGSDEWPLGRQHAHLHEVLDATSARPLSYRAVTGFLSRLDESGRTVPGSFYRDLESHQAATRPQTKSLAEALASGEPRRRHLPSRTAAELNLRRALSNLGLGYRLQCRPEPELRIRMDIVFMGAKVAVDLRSCAWQGCPLHENVGRKDPDRWAHKRARLATQGANQIAALRQQGWEVAVVWDHDDPGEQAHRIAQLVRSRRSSGSTAELEVG